MPCSKTRSSGRRRSGASGRRPRGSRSTGSGTSIASATCSASASCRRASPRPCSSSRQTAPPRRRAVPGRSTAASATRSRGDRVIGFGAQLSLHPPAEQFELVQRLEAVGYDSVWTGDHMSFHNPIHESITLLASYAPITKRIKLGVGVYLLALRSPAVAAKQAATLDVLSGGRLVFGVGVGGGNPKEVELCGVPHKERGARVNEGIDVVRTLWRDTPASFNGRFTRFESVSIDPKPVQQLPPIWIGGRSDAALARAGRQGDGWMSYVVQADRYAPSPDRVPAPAAAPGPPMGQVTAAHPGVITNS